MRTKAYRHFLMILGIVLLGGGMTLHACSAIKTTYRVTEETIETGYDITKGAAKLAFGTGKLVYRVGGYTFRVVTAPLSWPLTVHGLESIDDLPPKEAIRAKRVKRSPYVVNGKRYVPMTLQEAAQYRDTGIASWYGHETLRQPGGHMTANGEAFDPQGLTAAHKHLPLPTYVRVTNLANGRSLIVRVNDRGPFVTGRIIDLSAGAAKKLGFYRQGITRVRIQTYPLDG